MRADVSLRILELAGEGVVRLFSTIDRVVTGVGGGVGAPGIEQGGPFSAAVEAMLRGMAVGTIRRGFDGRLTG